jgi:hypothetical protein
VIGAMVMSLLVVRVLYLVFKSPAPREAAGKVRFSSATDEHDEGSMREQVALSLTE